MKAEVTRTGDLVSAPPGARWPDRCVRCGVPTEGRARFTLAWRDPYREPLVALIPLAVAVAAVALGSVLGSCGALTLVFLLYPVALQRRPIEIGACPTHAARLREERRFRWGLTLIAPTLLGAYLAIVLIKWGRDLSEILLPLSGPLGLFALATIGVALLAWRVAGALVIRATSPERLLIGADPAFVATLPPDPADAALDLSEDRPSSGSVAATSSHRERGESSPRERREGQAVSPDALNPFAALPVRLTPAILAPCRDGVEVLAPAGAEWPDRCLCCGRPAEGRRVNLHLLPLAAPLSRASVALGWLLAPLRAPFARLGVCGWHQLLWYAAPAVQIAAVVAILTARSSPIVTITALLAIAVGRYLSGYTALLSYEDGVARLSLPASLLTALPAAPPASRPAPRSPGSAPTGPAPADRG